MTDRNIKRKRSGRKSLLLYFKILFCAGIVCTAVYLKNAEDSGIEKVAQTIGEDLKIEEAVAAISNSEEDKESMAVFEKSESESEAPRTREEVFDSGFYIDDDNEKIAEELQKEKKRREEEEKKLSIETLSFSMSEEELSDDTKPEPFRIPPPSTCSYDKETIKFSYKTPLCGVITSRYGYRDHPIMDDASFHTGLDIAAKSGTTVAAFADGRVEDAGKNNTYGNYVLIEHKDGIKTFYGHNLRLTVKKGQKVSLGQKIAEVGSTGLSTGPHLHFEVRRGSIRLDPSLYISPEAL